MAGRHESAGSAQDGAGVTAIPRLIYNSDGDSTTFIAFEPPLTVDQACRDIEEVAGTNVEVISSAIGRGDDTFSHPTEFGDIYGQGVTQWPAGQAVKWVRWMAQSTKALLDQGVNIVELLAERSHQRGFQFWLALRMNDIHEDDSTRFAALRSNFKQEHRELLIGSPYPDPSRGYGQDDFTWAFDFARPEVRDRKLGIILETCQKYDIDGFELDFQRGPWYFKPGKEQEGMPLMTDFMRRIRQGTAEIAREKKRPFVLMIRVPQTVARCQERGLDVAQWIKEDLADLCVPMFEGYMDMGADIKGFVELTRGAKCRIGGGLEHLAKGYGHSGADVLYAGALSFWHQGAACIYLFNYDCHRMLYGAEPYTPEEIQVLKEIHDPNLIARKNKRYCVTVDMDLRTPVEGGLFPLPCELEKVGHRQSFSIWVGDDIEAARRDGALGQMWLRITYQDYDPEKTRAAVSMNGRQVTLNHLAPLPNATVATYDDVPAMRGPNEIVVSLDGSDDPAPMRIQGIELVITYNAATCK